MATGEYGSELVWKPERPKLRPQFVLLSWLVSAMSVYVASWVLPGFALSEPRDALLVAALLALANALIPPLIAALRLPFTLLLGFVLLLWLNAAILEWIDDVLPEILRIDGFDDALAAALLVAAVRIMLEVLLGTNDNDEHVFRTVRRIARRQGVVDDRSSAGVIYLEIDGLALPVLRRAMRDGHVPHMARWLADGGYNLTGWETDLSSQTGASQAGLLLGANDDIPAFRWVEKDTGRIVACSSPGDCKAIEQRLSTGKGLLANGGSSRGNLLSGDADEVILTVSRVDAERRSNPGYRAFFASSFNVTRTLALFFWEVILEWTAAIRAARRDVRPRGHRGGTYPFLRATMCVVVRDLVVFGVLTDMMRGRPAVYATFASYDEVAHHSGLERHDTLEALRKVDQQFGRIAAATRYAPRPYEIVVLSDHGQTQGATFKQRNGYTLAEYVERALETGSATEVSGGDEQSAMAGLVAREATGSRPEATEPDRPAPSDEAIVLGSGNLGLVYLMGSPERLTLEEIEQRHPHLIDALRAHPHIGWLLVRSAEHGAMVLGPRGMRRLADDVVEGEDPLAPFSVTAARHLLRTDTFSNVADIMVGSFYDADLDEACAFEELISFHGGLGGEQTEAFVLSPKSLPLPDGPIIGAPAMHEVLAGWRAMLNDSGAAGAEPAQHDVVLGDREVEPRREPVDSGL